MDKPLHVRVAEALGWNVLQTGDFWAGDHWMRTWPDGEAVYVGLPDHAGPGHSVVPVKRYDTDWSATGPLIERFGIALSPERLMTNPPRLDGYRASCRHEAGYGPNPQTAICNLILALHAAGKLEAA